MMGNDSPRTFGVEEELLLVDATGLNPLPAAQWVNALPRRITSTGFRLSPGSWQEQIVVASPRQSTLDDQTAAVHAGRALADLGATQVGGRVTALATAPGRVTAPGEKDPDEPWSAEPSTPTDYSLLLNRMHVHVGIESRHEAVTALDRMRIWLPTLLALSANSPFWRGRDSGYDSYRYHVALPAGGASGATKRFGSPDGYRRQLGQRGAGRMRGMHGEAGTRAVDALISEYEPTVQVRIADVCLDPADAAVIAALTRALVETGSRTWRQSAPDIPASRLQAWSWAASRSGVQDRLIDPASGALAPADDVVARLLDHVRPVLADYGDEEQVETVVEDIIRRGTGARRQRQAYASRREVRDIVADALTATHHSTAAVPSGS